MDESGFNNSSDYGLQPSPLEDVFLYWFQKKAVAEILYKILVKKYKAVMLIATPGAGKTFIQGAVDRRLKDMQFEKDKTWGLTTYLAITRNSVVEQTKRVLKERFGINPITETEVINIEKLRTRAGQIWINRITQIVDGEEVEIFEWKDLIYPAVIEIDECQAVKNPDTCQHEIIVSACNSDFKITFIFISATPFTRPSEAKAFAIATKKDISHWGFPPGTKLSVATWPTYISAVSHPSAPDEYNEAAIDRLMDDLSDYIVRVKGIKWQFNAINNVEIIDFEEPCADNDFFDARKYYNDAWERYLERKAKLEEAVTDNPRFRAMVELAMFLAAAEYAKVYIYAKRLDKDMRNGYAAYLAVKQKATIIKVVEILIEKYGWTRSDISLIWGGGQTQLTAKQKLKAQVRANEDVFKQAGITMEDMMLDEVEDRIIKDLNPAYKLGTQTVEQRQIEIDRYQSGKSICCIYTYSAGGVGLSIHHTDEQCNDWNRKVEGFDEWLKMIEDRNAKAVIFNKGIEAENKRLMADKKWPKAKAQVVKRGKIRRKESGYYVEEDIKYILTRPRKGTIGTTWSPIQLVQGACRAPRLTSLSNTEQTFLYYRGTVEADQAIVVTHRLKCLGKVVRQQEDWMDIIKNHDKAKCKVKELVDEYQKIESDEPTTEFGVNLGEEEEE